MATTGLLVFAVHTLAPARDAGETILVAFTVVLLTAGLFTVAACLMLALALVHLILEGVDVTPQDLLDSLFTFLFVVFGVMALRLQLFALALIATVGSIG